MAEDNFFRFLDLPPELRNRVYELLFKDRECRIDACTAWRGLPTRPRGRGNPFAVKLARLSNYGLLQANNQIRQEATSLFYAFSTFVFSSLKQTIMWLGILQPEHRRIVKRICLEYSTPLRLGLPSDEWMTDSFEDVEARLFRTAEQRRVSLGNFELTLRVVMK